MLRGRAASLDEPISATPANKTDPVRFRARPSRRPHFDDVAGDDRWTERTIVLLVVIVSIASGSIICKLIVVPQTLVALVAQTSFTRLQVLKSSTPRQASSPKHAQSDDLLEARTQYEKP